MTFLTASLVAFPIVFLRYVHCSSRFARRVTRLTSKVTRPPRAVAVVPVVESRPSPWAIAVVVVVALGRIHHQHLHMALVVAVVGTAWLDEVVVWVVHT